MEREIRSNFDDFACSLQVEESDGTLEISRGHVLHSSRSGMTGEESFLETTSRRVVPAYRLDYLPEDPALAGLFLVFPKTGHGGLLSPSADWPNGDLFAVSVDGNQVRAMRCWRSGDETAWTVPANFASRPADGSTEPPWWAALQERIWFSGPVEAVRPILWAIWRARDYARRGDSRGGHTRHGLALSPAVWEMEAPRLPFARIPAEPGWVIESRNPAGLPPRLLHTDGAEIILSRYSDMDALSNSWAAMSAEGMEDDRILDRLIEEHTTGGGPEGSPEIETIRGAV